MRKALAILAALLLVAALPVAAQTPAPAPPAGTVIVLVGQSDGTGYVPVAAPIVIPPMCPLPEDVS